MLIRSDPSQRCSRDASAQWSVCGEPPALAPMASGLLITRREVSSRLSSQGQAALVDLRKVRSIWSFSFGQSRAGPAKPPALHFSRRTGPEVPGKWERNPQNGLPLAQLLYLFFV